METVAIAAVALLLGVAVGYFIRRHERPQEGHVHSASTATPEGWHCDCGAHFHTYVFAVEGTEKKRCQCGKIGTGKEWA